MDEGTAMDPSTTLSAAMLPTDAEIDAVVRRLVAEVTGLSAPPEPAARSYERAVGAIAEEITELLAVLVPQR